MDLVFGKFVTAFNDFAVGTMDPAEYRSQVNKYTCEALVAKPTNCIDAKQSLFCVSFRGQVCLRLRPFST